MKEKVFPMRHCQYSVTTVHCGHKRVLKILLLQLSVLAKDEIKWDLTTAQHLLLLLKKTHYTFRSANFCTNPAGYLLRTQPVNRTPSQILYVSLVYWAKFLNLILFYWYQAIRSQNINKNATQRNSLERNCSSSACGDPAGAEREMKAVNIRL